MPAVTVVILNWNGKHWLEKFLPSVLATRYADFHVLVVDNGSTDDSVAWTQEVFPSVEVLSLPENYGFAEGNNKAISHIKTPYFVLLNSDVEVSPDWLSPLVQWMEAHPQAAAVQPRIRAYHQKDHFEYAGAAGGFMDRFGYPYCRGRLFDTLEKDQQQYEEPVFVSWTTGACMMLRKSVVEQIGLFDPDFFAHMEEIDFCWRAQNYGYLLGCEPKGVVYHVGGGTLPQGNPRKTFLNVRNSLWMLHKNLPSGQVFIRIFARLILDGVWGAQLALKGDWKTIGAIIKAHRAYFGSLATIRTKRAKTYAQAPTAWPKHGIQKGSVVWKYFAQGKKKWSSL